MNVTEEVVEFGEDPSRRRRLPRLVLGTAGFSALLAAGLWCQQNSSGTERAHGTTQESVRPATLNIDSHGDQLVFSKLGSFIVTGDITKPVDTEFSDLSCRHRKMHAEMYVYENKRTMLHFPDSRLPQNSMSFDCLLTGNIDATTQPWITVGASDYRYVVTDAKPPANTLVH